MKSTTAESDAITENETKTETENKTKQIEVIEINQNDFDVTFYYN